MICSHLEHVKAVSGQEKVLDENRQVNFSLIC